MSNQNLRQSFRVGYRFRCTMSARSDGDVHVEWEPRLPKRLSEREKRDYRAGRDRFLARMLGNETGLLTEVA